MGSAVTYLGQNCTLTLLLITTRSKRDSGIPEARFDLVGYQQFFQPEKVVEATLS